VSYANKYAAKSEQKEVPSSYRNVGRFWGVVFNRECVAAATRVGLRNDGQRTLKREIKGLRDDLKGMIGDGRAKKHAPNGRTTVYFIRSIVDQRRIKERIKGISFQYQMCEGIGGCYSEPNLEESSDSYFCAVR